MPKIPTRQALYRQALITKITHLVQFLNEAEMAGFHRFFPKGVDNLTFEQIETAYDLISRTLQGVTPDAAERVD